MHPARGALPLLLSFPFGCGEAAPDASVPTAEIAIVEQPATSRRRVPTKVCERGETEPCACPDEVTGVRTCSDDGTRMRACNCEPPKPPSETGIAECDEVLAYFDKLADDIEACSKGGSSMKEAADSIRRSRATMKDTFASSATRDARSLASITETCKTLLSSPVPFTCS